MPFNGTGTFVRVYSWQTDKANGVKIRADRMDGEDDGFATGLSTCITKDGQTTVTADIPFSGFKLTGIGAPTARTDAARASNLQDHDLTYFTTGGTGSAYTLTPSPAITALTAGQKWDVKFHTVSIGTAPTLQVSGLAAAPIVYPNGEALVNADLPAGGIIPLQYDGTNYQIVGRIPQGLANGGTKTGAYSASANTKYLVDATAAAFTTNLGGITTTQAIVRITKFGLNSHFLQGTVNGDANGFTINADQEGVLEVEYTGATRGFV